VTFRFGPGYRRPSKYGNVRRAAAATDPGSEYNGRVYDSKDQAAYAAELDQQKRAGVLKAWIPEVSFPLPGGIRVRPDFLILDLDDRMILRDVKGMPPTQAWKNKAKQLLALYGLKIEIVRRSGRRWVIT
jgi:hypothetical protein